MKADRIVLLHGEEILSYPKMTDSKKYIQHGNVSVYDHCVAAAVLCVKIAARFHIKTDEQALVRGALLHDYFLYDWHLTDSSHRWHGFIHARLALKNAERDFELNDIERDMILRHMFPLNIHPPKYRESVILCVADKICSIQETTDGVKTRLIDAVRRRDLNAHN